jgi:hypothetical protein
MKYTILLITASIFIFSPISVFAQNNLKQDNLISCRRSKDAPPDDYKGDRSGA